METEWKDNTIEFWTLVGGFLKQFVGHDTDLSSNDLKEFEIIDRMHRCFDKKYINIRYKNIYENGTQLSMTIGFNNWYWRNCRDNEVFDDAGTGNTYVMVPAPKFEIKVGYPAYCDLTLERAAEHVAFYSRLLLLANDIQNAVKERFNKTGIVCCTQTLEEKHEAERSRTERYLTILAKHNRAKIKRCGAVGWCTEIFDTSLRSGTYAFVVSPERGSAWECVAQVTAGTVSTAVLLKLVAAIPKKQ